MPSPQAETPTRRRRTTNDPPRKTGWQVRSSVAEAVKQAVQEGAAESQNAFVERALVRELRALRRQRVYEAYAAAAKDPAFVADMARVSQDLEPAVGDGLGDAD
jgi:hypothetical protein